MAISAVKKMIPKQLNIFLKKIRSCLNPWNVWTWAYLVKGSLQIKLRILRWDHPELAGWALYPMTSALMRDTWRRHSEEGVMWPQHQCLEWYGCKPRKPGANRSWKRQNMNSPPESLTESAPLQTPGSGTSAFQDCPRILSCCFKPFTKAALRN